jgi:hypothetical protein
MGQRHILRELDLELIKTTERRNRRATGPCNFPHSPKAIHGVSSPRWTSGNINVPELSRLNRSGENSPFHV